MSCQVVGRNSASVHADPDSREAMDNDHSGLNKFSSPKDDAYQKLHCAVTGMIAPPKLETADKKLQDLHYRENDSQRLKIDRLSGHPLPIDQCYVNLAIIARPSDDGTPARPKYSKSLRSSLLARQKAETPDRTAQVELSGIFDPFKPSPDDPPVIPRRILIRGRAGVGKTTVCKKMVKDLISDEQSAVKSSWGPLFDRVLWIPLRNLRKSQAPTNLQDLIFREFFENKMEIEDGRMFAREIEREVERTDGKRTLFILDGLDEVVHNLEEHGDISPLLLALLNKQNVIITSRPNARLPSQVKRIHLEMETVGFYPAQVSEYIRRHPGIRERAEEIQSFLQKNWLLQGLVRIPIQLEALCYTWEDQMNTVTTTMTSIYQAIEEKLWRKDVVRLGRLTQPSAQFDKYSDVQRKVSNELKFLEFLAFNGLCSGLFEFNPQVRSLVEQGRDLKANPPSDQDLAELSFLRTSDPLAEAQNRSFHFIHLTFQEYFAARHFVQMWKEDKELEIIVDGQGKKIYLLSRPEEFLSRHKYFPQYDVFWRFVAGLLSEDSEEITSFFDQLAQNPKDLLGSTHQRLLMHCLSEVPTSSGPPYREKLEKHFSEWLLAEIDIAETAHLAEEAELPERSLAEAIKAASEESRLSILYAMGSRPFLEDGIVYQLTGRLETKIPATEAFAAIKALEGPQGFQYPHDLSEHVFDTISGRLEDENKYVRMAALLAFQNQGEPRPRILEAIVKSVTETQDSSIISAALRTLRCQQNLGPDILKAILGFLEDKERRITFGEESVEIIQHQDALNSEILNIISNLLEDASPQNRLLAIKALQTRRYTSLDDFEVYCTFYGDGNLYFDRLPPIVSLQSRAGLSQEILNTITRKLADETDPEIRKLALSILQNQQEGSQYLSLTLRNWLRSQDMVLFDEAVAVLEDQQCLSHEILTTIIEITEGTENTRMRIKALTALEAIQKRHGLSTEVLDMVPRWLCDEDQEFRSAALKAFQLSINPSLDLPESSIAFPGDKIQRPRSPIAATKGSEHQQDLSPQFATPTFERLDDTDWHRHRSFSTPQFQGHLGPDALNAILVQLKGEDSSLRLAATGALLGLKDLAPDILYAVANLSQDRNWLVRRSAVEILKCQKNLSSDLLVDVANFFEDEDWRVRLRAVEIFEPQENLSHDLLIAVTKFFEDEDWRVRESAAEIFERQEHLSPDLLLAVTKFLEDKKWHVRLSAVTTFQKQTNTNLDIPNALIQRLTDNVHEVRWAAVDVLRHRQDLSFHMLEPIIERLYQILLKVSFSQNVHMFIADGSLNMGFDSHVLRFQGTSSQLSSCLDIIQSSAHLVFEDSSFMNQEQDSTHQGHEPTIQNQDEIGKEEKSKPYKVVDRFWRWGKSRRRD